MHQDRHRWTWSFLGVKALNAGVEPLAVQPEGPWLCVSSSFVARFANGTTLGCARDDGLKTGSGLLVRTAIWQSGQVMRHASSGGRTTPMIRVGKSLDRTGGAIEYHVR